MITTILTYVTAFGPALIAIGGIIKAVCTLIKSNKATSGEVITTLQELKESVLNTKEYEELKDQLCIAHAENAVLKKQLNELLTKIDHIVRE